MRVKYHKIFFIIFFLSVCHERRGLAEQNTLYIENLASYRHEISSDGDEDVYIDRLTIGNLYNSEYARIMGELSSFFELRRHFIIERWYLNTIGTNFVTTFFKNLKLANSIQYSWSDIKDGYFKNPQRLDINRLELASSISIDLQIWKPQNKVAVSLAGIAEYFYDIQHGIPVRNEIGAGLALNIRKRARIGLGWRHLDWIKDFDSDQLEASVAIKFQ